MKRLPVVYLVALFIAGLAEAAAPCAWDTPPTPFANVPSDEAGARSAGAALNQETHHDVHST
jgi:hypothetical protein